METLQLLKDYASTNDNVWLTNKLEILEQQIKLAILEAEIKEIKKMIDNTKNIFN